LLPFQGSFFPYINIAYEENQHENPHLHKAKNPETLEKDRPWVKENTFNIEQDKQHRNKIELDREALLSSPYRITSALVRLKLDRRQLLLSDQGRENDRTETETYGYYQKQNYREICP